MLSRENKMGEGISVGTDSALVADKGICPVYSVLKSVSRPWLENLVTFLIVFLILTDKFKHG